MPLELENLQNAIREESLDGWLFSNFRFRDKLTNSILQIPSVMSNTRPWFYAVPARGEPLKIVNIMEQAVLDFLPGKKAAYGSREELLAAFRPLAGKSWGAHISENIPAISYLDAGTAANLEAAGLKLVSAANLIQRFKGLLNAEALESHLRAADALYEIMDEVWEIVTQSCRNGTPLHEGELRRFILDAFKKRGLITHLPPIVAAGVHTGDPHYPLTGRGGIIQAGDLIQFDIWAKEEKPGAIYADISQLGIYGEAADPEIERTFANLVSVREKILEFIKKELEAGKRPRGFDVDRAARNFLDEYGYAGALLHRIGHGIDTECHGSGVNIDSVEFPDDRLLLDGACFSLEPAVYFDTFGMRTEINVYISEGKAFVSGGERQFLLRYCPERK